LTPSKTYSFAGSSEISDFAWFVGLASLEPTCCIGVGQYDCTPNLRICCKQLTFGRIGLQPIQLKWEALADLRAFIGIGA